MSYFRRARSIRLYVALLAAAFAGLVFAQDVKVEPVDSTPGAPKQVMRLDLAQLAPASDFKLFGLRDKQQLEFTLRRDQQVTDAKLNLVFTPSPALLQKLSHVRVYLNDELMGVVPMAENAMGRQQRHSLELDPHFLATFNRLNLEFVGHYTDVCEDLSHSSLWLDVSRQTNVVINQQGLPLANELSFFPEPFFDKNDMNGQKLPFVFAGPPNVKQLQVAAVLASYFGTQANWRSLQFPVVYGHRPKGHAIVFAINGARPEFLAGYPEVDGPTVDMISAPDDPYQKLLLVLGRNDDDLVVAVSALAMGGALLRGQSVKVDEVTALAPRRPYDAPNWMPIDRPVRFSELKDYDGQLETVGQRAAPITLNLNLPPDLFVWRNTGIPMDIRYRYTAPSSKDESRLTLTLNGRFVNSYPLHPAADSKGLVARTRLPLLGAERAESSEALDIPALKIGARNRLQFDFSFASTVGAAQPGLCKTVLPVEARGSIDGLSTIDFSGFGHYLEMPNIGAFASSGFPFSRMADLSETAFVMPSKPTTQQVSTLLEVAAHIGSKVGYPAHRVRVTDSWPEALELDADLVWIGNTPEGFRDRPDANLLLEDTVTRLRQPRRPSVGLPDTLYGSLARDADGHKAVSQIRIRSTAPIAAIVGMQSERFPQRSMMGFLASSDNDFALLRAALADAGKRETMKGSVVIVRESGVTSETVGNRYFVGHLQWWQLIWFHLSDRPFLLASLAAFVVLAAALLLWQGLRWVARRRLMQDA